MPDAPTPSPSLAGRIAVVTGASRGGGRATAIVLGEAGATVYVTARSSARTGPAADAPGTIEETAAAVEERGGTAVPVRCDHTDDDQVEALFARIAGEQGRLDLLVNNAWGGYEGYGPDFDAPVWEQPLERWDRMFTAGVRAGLVTSRFAAPLLIDRPPDGPPGLIVNTIAWAFGEYLGNLIYDTAKAATARMAFGLSEELRPHRVTAVALAPGFMRTERVEAALEGRDVEFGPTETPEYLGRAVAALAADPEVMGRGGQLLTAGELAREYGFTDVDGRRPEPFRLP